MNFGRPISPSRKGDRTPPGYQTTGRDLYFHTGSATGTGGEVHFGVEKVMELAMGKALETLINTFGVRINHWGVNNRKLYVFLWLGVDRL